MEVKFDYDEIKAFMDQHPDAKIYIGSDSQRLKKKKIRFATVIIVHYEGNKGAKVFHEIDYEKVVDAKLSRPFNRMMAEVKRIIDTYTILEDYLMTRDFEIHLDIATDETKGSSVAHGAAKGYIYSIIGVEPVFKPESWASSCVADHYSK